MNSSFLFLDIWTRSCDRKTFNYDFCTQY